MRRYKLAVHIILVVLSVFNFVPVLTAPVQVREVREACADVAVRSGDVVVVSGKRAEEGQDPLTQASPSHVSALSSDPQGSLSTSDHIHQETTNPIEPPSSPSPSGEIRRPEYALGGANVPWYSKGDPELHQISPGGVQQIQPGLMSKPQPGYSVRTKTYPFAPGHWGANTGQATGNTEIGPATPSESSGEIAPASPNKLEDLTQIDAEPQKPQSKLSKLVSKSKSFFRKLGQISKSLFREMVDNPHVQFR
jgi:hypothetical protein